MKIFLDTNFFVRYLIPDNEERYKECATLLENIEKGEITAYISNIVLLEISFLLKSFYKIKKDTIVQDLKGILLIRNLVLIETTDFVKALEIHDKKGIKLADCLIYLQVPEKTILITYDKEFKKIKNVVSKTPGEFLSV